jgi:hypothetical protein
MKLKNNQSGLAQIVIIALFVLLLGVIGFAGWKVWDGNNKPPTQPTTTSNTASPQPEQKTSELQPEKPLLAGNFGSDGDYGVTQIEGYANVAKINDDNCMMMEDTSNCEEVDYVYFNITNSGNSKLIEYINNLAGNSFVSDMAIGMGCYADSKISYSNASDAKGFSSYEISKSDTEKILSATKEKPIRIEIERFKLTTGRGAPSCYSHFATFKIVNL